MPKSKRRSQKKNPKKTSSSLPGTKTLGSRNAWDIGHAEIDQWFAWLDDVAMTSLQARALINLWESMQRLSKKRIAVDDLRERLPKHHRPNGGMTQTDKDELFEATESFFQNFYGVLSGLASVVIRFNGQVFDGQATTSTMAKFVDWLNKRFEAPGHFDILQEARAFRALLDHPDQKQPYTWQSATIAGGPVRIVLFGPGAVPTGGHEREFADGKGWDMDAPYEGFVSTMMALAIRSCLWQIHQWGSGLEITSPIVTIASTRPAGHSPEMNSLKHTGFAKVIAINDAAPSPHVPESEDQRTYTGYSFGRKGGPPAGGSIS